VVKRVGSRPADLAHLQDGSVVMTGGFTGSGYPATLVAALRERGTRDLTLIVNSAGTAPTGVGILIANRQVRKVVCSFPIGRYARQGMETFWDLYNSGQLEIQV